MPSSQSSPQSKSSFGIDKVPTLDDAILIVDSDVYEIRDLYLKDSKGLTRATISKTVLHASMQTRGHVHNNPDDKDEWYTFEQGQGIMILQGSGWSKAKFVEAGSYVLVEKGVFHLVINTGKSTDLIFLAHYPGDMRRPPFNG